MSFCTRRSNLLFVMLIALILPACSNNRQVAKPQVQVIFIDNSWDEALKQAAEQKKYIFVNAYASWCGPCKLLKATTFKDAGVADFYNTNFINVSIDMEKGDGPELAGQWQIQAYPTLIIFDSSGRPVTGTVGYIKPKALVRFGIQALNK